MVFIGVYIHGGVCTPSKTGLLVTNTLGIVKLIVDRHGNSLAGLRSGLVIPIRER